MPDPRIIDGDIAELEAEFERGNQTWGVATKLSTLYTLRDHISPAESTVGPYSTARSTTYGDTDFLRLVSGKDVAGVLSVMDDLMDTLRVVNHKAYNRVMQNLDNLR